MANKEILLSDILEKCLDFRQNPTEETYAEIAGMIAKIDVRERLTLAEKGFAVMSVLDAVKSNSNALECAFELESGFFFKGTLSYALNLKIDIPATLMNIETYDLLITFGLEDRILNFCSVDHARLRKMLDDAVNFSNIFKLVDSTKLISGENIAELKTTLNTLKDTLTLDKIKELKGLMVETEPVWTELKKTIGEEATFAVNAKNVEDFRKSLEEKQESRTEGVVESKSEPVPEEFKEEVSNEKSECEPPAGE
jgi:hypothetical protein